MKHQTLKCNLFKKKKKSFLLPFLNGYFLLEEQLALVNLH